MRLSREKGCDVEISTPAELDQALADLGTGDQDFAVLDRGDGAFAQAAGSRSSGFVFEVREGDVHRQSRRSDLSREEVLALFAAWLEGDERWRTAAEWGPGPSDPASGSAGGWIPATYRHAGIVLALALVLIGAAEWKRQRTRDLVDHLDHVAGEVVSTRRMRSSSGGTKSRYATARFTAGGRTWDVEDRVYDQPKVGSAVWVWFDPRDPARTASLSPSSYRWGWAIALYAASGLVALFAAKIAYDVSRRPRPSRSSRSDR
jgi:hypothetical protein